MNATMHTKMKDNLIMLKNSISIMLLSQLYALHSILKQMNNKTQMILLDTIENLLDTIENSRLHDNICLSL